MAKGDDDKVKQAQGQQQKAETYRTDVSQPRYDQFNTDALNAVGAARTSGQGERDYLTGAYKTGLESPYSMPGQGAGASANGEAPESGDGGGGGGGSNGPAAAPTDPWATSFGLYSGFANNGGVDMGALTEALPGFRNMASTGGFSDAQKSQLDSIGSQFGDISRNPIDPSSLATINSNVSNLSNYGTSGGYDPAALGRIRGDIDSMRNMASTGGYDPTQLAGLRSYVSQLGNYQPDLGQSPADIQKLRDWGNTGGYTDQDISNERLRGSSTVSALYQNQADNMARQRALTGGLAPGYGAAQRAMTRDLSQQQAAAALNTESTLQQNIRTNKFAGMTAAQQAELSQQTMANQARLSALTGAANYGNQLEGSVASNRINATNLAGQGEGNLEANLAGNRINASNLAATQGLNLGNSQAQNRMSALTGQRDTTMGQVNTANDAIIKALTGISSTQQGAQQLSQQGKMFGASGINSVENQRQAAAQAAAALAASSGASSAGLSQQNSQFNAQMAEMQREFNLTGLQKLYGTADPTLNAANSAFLQGQGQQDQSNLSYLGFGMPYTPPQQQGSDWTKYLGIGSSLLGAMGGGGSSGGNATTGGNGGVYGGGYQFGNGNSGYTPFDPSVGTTIPNPSL